MVYSILCRSLFWLVCCGPGWLKYLCLCLLLGQCSGALLWWAVSWGQWGLLSFYTSGSSQRIDSWRCDRPAPLVTLWMWITSLPLQGAGYLRWIKWHSPFGWELGFPGNIIVIITQRCQSHPLMWRIASGSCCSTLVSTSILAGSL